MEFYIRGLYHDFIKTDLRICIKDYIRNKNLKSDSTMSLFPRKVSFQVNRGRTMNNTWRVILVVAFSIGCFVGFGFLPNGSLIYLLLFAAALIISLAAGARHLSLPARIFITTQIFCWNFMLCLLGRTVEPGITRGNTSMVLLYFGIYGFVPGLCLLRLWRLKFGAILLGSLLPVGFAMACGGADFAMLAPWFSVAHVAVDEVILVAAEKSGVVKIRPCGRWSTWDDQQSYQNFQDTLRQTAATKSQSPLELEYGWWLKYRSQVTGDGEEN
jgi:hypothetical protein